MREAVPSGTQDGLGEATTVEEGTSEVMELKSNDELGAKDELGGSPQMKPPLRISA